jgi:hypothetical protein
LRLSFLIVVLGTFRYINLTDLVFIENDYAASAEVEENLKIMAFALPKAVLLGLILCAFSDHIDACNSREIPSTIYSKVKRTKRKAFTLQKPATSN